MPSSSLPHAAPRARVLSNGGYTVMLTDAGSGFSHWRDLAVTRWREDPTTDGWGSYFLLRNVESEAVWSAGLQPCRGEPDGYATTDSRGVHLHRLSRWRAGDDAGDRVGTWGLAAIVTVIASRHWS